MSAEDNVKLEWQNGQRRVRDLVPYEFNPRKLSDAGYARLKASLEYFGLVEVPVVDADDLVLAGHQRLRILLDLGRGDELIDVRLPNRKLTLEEFKRYNVTSNAQAGEWDYESLLVNFGDLDLAALLDTNAFEALSALATSLEVPAEEQEFVPVLPEQAETVPGDVYEFHSPGGRGLVHRLVCGSSLEMDVVARALGAGQLADLTLTDPPYNVNYEGKTKKALKIENDKMSGSSFYQFLYDFYTSAFAHMRAGAPIYVFHADSEGANFRQALVDAGLKLSECLVWVKQSFVMGRQDYHWQHEPILYGWKEGAAHTWCSDRKQSTVLPFDRPSRNAEHPTMKPLDILEYLLGCSSKEGAVVFDGFGGSGSLLLACEKTGRQARVVELDGRYCDVHVHRWVKFMQDNQRRFTVVRNGEELADEQLAAYQPQS